MSLKDSISLLKRKQLELKKEYENVKKELERILFDNPLKYKKVYIPQTDKYYIYPCIQAPKDFYYVSEEVNLTDNSIIKKYFLSNVTDMSSIKITETAYLREKSKSFNLQGLSGIISTHVIFKICYSIKLDDFEFEFLKNIPVNDVIKNYDEKFNINLLNKTLESVILRNQKIENNFYASIKPFLFEENNVNTSLLDLFNTYFETKQSVLFLNFLPILECRVEIESSKKEQRVSVELNVNGTSISFSVTLEIVNYSAKIFLKTLVYKKIVMFFSDSGYGILDFNIPDYEVEIGKLFLS